MHCYSDWKVNSRAPDNAFYLVHYIHQVGLEIELDTEIERRTLGTWSASVISKQWFVLVYAFTKTKF